MYLLNKMKLKNFLLIDLLPVAVITTLDMSFNPYNSQVPLPVSPMHPKSCAQSIIKNASYFLHIYYNSFKSAVSESIENKPSVITNIP